MSRLSELWSRIEESDLYFRFQKLEHKKKKFSLGAIGLFSLFVPFLFSYIESVLIFTLIYCLVGIGIYLLIGHAGIVSLGQTGFYCMGAYISAILTLQFGWSPWIAICFAALINGGIAYILGKPSLAATTGRTEITGLSLAATTLAFGFLVFLVVSRLPFTGGHDGITGIPDLYIGTLKFNDHYYYYLLWAVVGLALLFTYNLTDQKLGRGWRALNVFAGGDEVAAYTSGLDVVKLKVRAFVIAAVYASIAGSILAHWLGTVVPELFNVATSLIFVMMVGIGGLGSIWGALTGAVFYFGLKETLTNFLGGQVPLGVEAVIFSFIFIIILVFAPGGITGFPDKWREWTHKEEEVISKREWLN